MQSPRKKRPPKLHVSQARIQAELDNVALRTSVRIASLNAVAEQIRIAQAGFQAERGNVVLRTRVRIASLHAVEEQHRIAQAQPIATVNWHFCLKTICFFLLLLLLNLLFL